MHNEVVIEGQLTRDPVQRQLKAGERIWLLSVAAPQVSGSGVDWLDCSVRSGRLLRAVAFWQCGDVVRLEGHVRRRFFHVAGVRRSTLEITAASGRRTRRAPAA